MRFYIVGLLSLLCQICLISCTDKIAKCRDFYMPNDSINVITEGVIRLKCNHRPTKSNISPYDVDSQTTRNQWISMINEDEGLYRIFLRTDRTFGWKHRFQLVHDEGGCKHKGEILLYKPSLQFENISLCDDIVLIEDHFHNAFTDLQVFKESMYLSFRQSGNHVPITEDEYVVVKILKQDKGEWYVFAAIQKKGWDLRDPKLYVYNNKLCVLCGYSKLVGSSLEKQGTCISLFENGAFSEPQTIETDIDNICWI